MNSSNHRPPGKQPHLRGGAQHSSPADTSQTDAQADSPDPARCALAMSEAE
ncbi:hypothetical protein D4764_06G0003480 [Takifugu flavidus]|uniref:Uncharacterized protein n=1 Tax=Takifugu flavidus TaxID=433684 RepID=A0A5C6MWX6_9TELE|nr:hypothetical protein D4764_06G0003480 [Takifugu flavidus]